MDEAGPIIAICLGLPIAAMFYLLAKRSENRRRHKKFNAEKAELAKQQAENTEQILDQAYQDLGPENIARVDRLLSDMKVSESADAFRKRTPEEQIEVIKVAITELEKQGKYNKKQIEFLKTNWRRMLLKHRPFSWVAFETLGDFP